MTKTKRTKAACKEKPGGTEWRTANGRVFMGSQLMGAWLQLDGVNTAVNWRALKAKTYRLAAQVVEASEKFDWSVSVDSDNRIKIETVLAGQEAFAAAHTLVKILEGME